MNMVLQMKSIGRHFGTEEQLIESLVNFLNLTRGNRFNLLVEHEGGFGRPDVLLYETSPDMEMEIEALAALNPRLAPLLSTDVASNVHTLQDIANVSGSSTRASRQIVHQLAAIGHLVKSDLAQDRFDILPIPKPPFPQVIAIEGKLRDWRRALVQACRYLHFSTEAWVVLDHNFAKSAIASSHMFEASGVGLASFTNSGILHTHVHARNKKWQSNPLSWRTQTLLARKTSVN